jgi:hypothetical protein
MKKLLAVSAVVLAIVGWDAVRAYSQAATDVPRKIIGEWCSVGGDTSTTYYKRRSARTRCDRKNDEVFVIGRDSYKGSEYVCRYVKVTTDNTNTQIDSKCDGEGWAWTQHATISLSKGQLAVKTRKTSPERR